MSYIMLVDGSAFGTAGACIDIEIIKRVWMDQRVYCVGQAEGKVIVYCVKCPAADHVSGE